MQRTETSVEERAKMCAFGYLGAIDAITCATRAHGRMGKTTATHAWRQKSARQFSDSARRRAGSAPTYPEAGGLELHAACRR